MSGFFNEATYIRGLLAFQDIGHSEASEVCAQLVF